MQRSRPKRPVAKPGRKIIAYIATSADGYIARPDGSVDWLDRPRTIGDEGMAECARSVRQLSY